MFLGDEQWHLKSVGKQKGINFCCHRFFFVLLISSLSKSLYTVLRVRYTGGALCKYLHGTAANTQAKKKNARNGGEST
jgi:hypothetical protein